jgi:hypothetical protein
MLSGWFISIYLSLTVTGMSVPMAAPSTAACLLRSWVRIPPDTWIFVCRVYCSLSGRGLCDELITRPEESYRLWRVVVCDQETSCYGEAIARAGFQSQRNKQAIVMGISFFIYACLIYTHFFQEYN